MPLIALAPCSALHDYEAAIRRTGADVRLLDPHVDQPDAIVREVDGLLLPGGHDIDPALYGEAPHPTFVAAEPGRDAWEIALVQRAADVDLPVLAICRGIQVLNVARGGTLVQDIPSQLEAPLTHRVREPSHAIAHDVWIAEGSLLARLMAERIEDDTCPVNSRHHQAIRTIGRDLVVTATAPDGVIEAVEDPAQRFCVGVQWHPENFYRTGEFRGLFEGVVAAGRR
jgi:putative glutamine amidotransferase